MNKPDILFVMTDQHAFDCLSCNGHEILQTPNMDRIAKEGINFTNAYTPSPICAPARASVFSGKFPYPSGVVSNWYPFLGEIILFPERLQNVGYRTAEVGKLHFTPHEKRFGFQYKKLHDAPYNTYSNDADHSDYIKWLQQTRYKDNPDEPIKKAEEDENCFKNGNWYKFYMGTNWREEKYHSTTWTADESIRYLQSLEGDQPFFLFTSFFGPHQPFIPSEPYASMFDPEQIKLPPQFYAEMDNNPVFQATKADNAAKHKKEWDEKTYKKMLAAYYGGIAMIDKHLGRIFEQLEKMGKWDDTMIIFASDHGDHTAHFGLFSKGDMYDSSVKVPLLIKPPRSKFKGHRVDKNVNTLDLFGTILDAAGDTDWRNGDNISSRSLIPFFSKPAEDVDWLNETFSFIGGNPDSSTSMCRMDHLKMIRHARKNQDALYELYDMNDEIYDTRNVFEDPEYRDARDEMKKRLDKFWAEQKKLYPAHQLGYTHRAIAERAAAKAKQS